MRMTLRTYFSRINLPLKDRNLEFHIFSFFLTLSITDCQNLFLLGLSPRGAPRYIVGKEPTLKSMQSANRANSSSGTLHPNSKDFEKLILSPEISRNGSKTAIILRSWFTLLSQTISISSVNGRWFKKHSSPIFTPHGSAPISNWFNKDDKEEEHMLKSKGDKGSPWRNPFSIWKKSVGDPLTKTANVAVEIQLCIQVIHLEPNPKSAKVFNRKVQSTLSYAFANQHYCATVGFLQINEKIEHVYFHVNKLLEIIISNCSRKRSGILT